MNGGFFSIGGEFASMSLFLYSVSSVLSLSYMLQIDVSVTKFVENYSVA